MAWFFPLDFDFVPVFFSTRVLTRDERQIPVYLGQPEQQKLIKKKKQINMHKFGGKEKQSRKVKPPRSFVFHPFLGAHFPFSSSHNIANF